MSSCCFDEDVEGPAGVAVRERARREVDGARTSMVEVRWRAEVDDVDVDVDVDEASAGEKTMRR